MGETYELTQLKGGSWTLRLGTDGEVMHPGMGPAAEAKALYVEQLRLRERFKEGQPFVIWDVGLGAAANAVAAFNAAAESGDFKLHVVSFDLTSEPLKCALKNVEVFEFLRPYERHAQALIEHRATVFGQGSAEITWELRLGDFPEILESAALPRPRAIFYDPFSPATNPTMWTQEVFTKLFAWCAPNQPCALATYSRSTRVRVALLLAGFFVGRGRSSGRKEETTVAANARHLISELLDKSWLERVQRSGSAEPMRIGDYGERAISPETFERLTAHPQFK